MRVDTQSPSKAHTNTDTNAHTLANTAHKQVRTNTQRKQGHTRCSNKHRQYREKCIFSLFTSCLMYFCISAFVIISFVTLEEQIQTQTTIINTARAHLQVISCLQINRQPLRYTAQTNTNKHTTNLNTTHAYTEEIPHTRPTRR